MIKANELRMGNWVYAQSRKPVKGMHEPVQLSVVTPQSQNTWWPIPLTPEWLERCGFKNKDKSLCYQGTFLLCNYNEDNIFWFYDGDRGTPLKNLHQLQNLYFALTGEDLEIKL